MRAVILVGGEGTRLRPLTYRTPKAMVPILNRPFLEQMLAYLERHGIDQVKLALGHQPDAIRDYFAGDRAGSVRLDPVVEPEPLGSGGAIKQFERELDEPFFAFNGDILTDMDLTAMVAAHRQSGALISIGLIEVDEPSGFGVVKLGESKRIEAFVEKPPRELAPSRWANAGVWLFQPEALARVPAGRRSMVETELFPEAIAAGLRVQGFTQRCFWVDIGTPQRYLDVQLRMLEQPSLRILPLVPWPGGPYLNARPSPDAVPPQVAADAVLSGPVLLGEQVSIGAGARIVGPAVLGDGCRIAAGAVVERSVLWDRVHVDADAHVVRSVAASGVVVGRGARLEGAICGHDALIQPDDEIRDARIDPPDPERTPRAVKLAPEQS